MESVGSQGRIYLSMAKTSSMFIPCLFIQTLLALWMVLVFSSQDRNRWDETHSLFSPAAQCCSWSSSLPWIGASPPSPAAKHQGGHETRWYSTATWLPAWCKILLLFPSHHTSGTHLDPQMVCPAPPTTA